MCAGTTSLVKSDHLAASRAAAELRKAVPRAFGEKLQAKRTQTRERGAISVDYPWQAARGPARGLSAAAREFPAKGRRRCASPKFDERYGGRL